MVSKISGFKALSASTLAESACIQAGCPMHPLESVTKRVRVSKVKFGIVSPKPESVVPEVPIQLQLKGAVPP